MCDNQIVINITESSKLYFMYQNNTAVQEDSTFLNYLHGLVKWRRPRKKSLRYRFRQFFKYWEISVDFYSYTVSQANNLAYSVTNWFSGMKITGWEMGRGTFWKNQLHMNMGLINKVDMVCLSPVGLWCLADVSSVSPSSEQTAVVIRHVFFFIT